MDTDTLYYHIKQWSIWPAQCNQKHIRTCESVLNAPPTHTSYGTMSSQNSNHKWELETEAETETERYTETLTFVHILWFFDVARFSVCSAVTSFNILSPVTWYYFTLFALLFFTIAILLKHLQLAGIVLSFALVFNCCQVDNYFVRSRFLFMDQHVFISTNSLEQIASKDN